MLGGKGKAYLFIAQTGYEDVFSAHAGTCTVNTWALYVLYDLYGKSQSRSREHEEEEVLLRDFQFTLIQLTSIQHMQT
jgi:hypothetical protein